MQVPAAARNICCCGWLKFGVVISKLWVMQKTARRVRPRALGQGAFAPFGDVIEVGGEPLSINEGHSLRYHDLARLDFDAAGGRASVNIFRTTPLSLPITIRMMERHPLSSQAFYPLSNQPYLVVVAPKGELSPAAIEVFIASGRQGVNYAAGTWHHYSLALGATADFLVLDREGEGNNCDEVQLRQEDWLVVDLDGAPVP